MDIDTERENRRDSMKPKKDKEMQRKSYRKWTERERSGKNARTINKERAKKNIERWDRSGERNWRIVRVEDMWCGPNWMRNTLIQPIISVCHFEWCGRFLCRRSLDVKIELIWLLICDERLNLNGLAMNKHEHSNLVKKPQSIQSIWTRLIDDCHTNITAHSLFQWDRQHAAWREIKVLINMKNKLSGNGKGL